MFDLVFADPDRQERMGLLLAVLAYEQPDIDTATAYVQPILDLRLRDAWVEKQPDGPPVLTVYTRNGGGNREHFHDGTDLCLACHGEAATRHSAYLRDADDEFDATYRTYWFSFPDDLPSEVQEGLREGAEDPRDMSRAWLAAIDALSGAQR